MQAEFNKQIWGHFNKDKDAEKLQILVRIFAQVYENIIIKRKSNNSQDRAFQILETCKYFP